MSNVEGEEIMLPGVDGRRRGGEGVVEFMNRLILLKLLSVLAVVMMCSSCGAPGRGGAGVAPRTVGVYDSRSIAAAYVESPLHEVELDKLRKKFEGSEELDDELHGEVQAASDRSYTKDPVDDLLKKIEGKLPKIKKEAGVSVLVSKWDVAGLKKHEGAEPIDVTMALVDAFDPTPSQREHAVGIQDWAPPE